MVSGKTTRLKPLRDRRKRLDVARRELDREKLDVARLELDREKVGDFHARAIRVLSSFVIDEHMARPCNKNNISNDVIIL
jgi:hypothetical protein